MQKHYTHQYGYFHIVIQCVNGHALLKTNSERAFVITYLQDTLTPRLLIDELPAYKQLASCIDLLAFCITSQSINLLVFSIDRGLVKQFVASLTRRLMSYQAEYSSSKPEAIVSSIVTRLHGPHEALIRSATIHQLSPDWEYDRYSSIGFYLHDRRGDWMRIWRLAKLYNNKPSRYRALIQDSLSIFKGNTKPETADSLPHE